MANEGLPAPGFQKPTDVWGRQLGDEYSAPMDLELLASETGRFTQIGCTVAGAAPPAAPLTGPGYVVGNAALGQSASWIPLGTVMGRVTATKKYVPYTSGATNGAGSGVPVGILRHSVDTTRGDQQANLVISGIVRNSLVSGADAGAITSLNGRADAVNDLFVF
jgi:hypothetical protein